MWSRSRATPDEDDDETPDEAPAEIAGEHDFGSFDLLMIELIHQRSPLSEVDETFRFCAGKDTVRTFRSATPITIATSAKNNTKIREMREK